MGSDRRGVFVNYRSVDSGITAPALHRELSRRFGSDLVFLASSSIGAGEDYVEGLRGGLRSMAVLIAVIGPQRLTASDAAGRRRIDDPDDWIHRELAAAFAAKVRVIPVLLDGATVPSAAELPKALAALSRCQSRRLRRREYARDLEAIVEALIAVDPALAAAAGARPPAPLPAPTSLASRRRLVARWAAPVAVGVLALAVGIGLALAFHNPPATDARRTPSSEPSGTRAEPVGDPPVTSTATSVDATGPTGAVDPTTSAAAAARVRWQGTLELSDAWGATGGWFLDPAPPAPAANGDLYVGGTHKIAGQAMAAWNGPAPPDLAQCTDLLSTHLGRRNLDVRVGSMGCFSTEDGRVGQFTVQRTSDPGALNQTMTVAATVWEQ